MSVCLSGDLDPNRSEELHPSSPPSSSSSGPSMPSDSGYHGSSSSGNVGSVVYSDSGAQGIHLLLRPPDLLSPSLRPALPPNSQPTSTPPPPWDQGLSLEEAWGSGDYLETLSFLLPDGEELALATPLPHLPHDHDWTPYDTTFPTRHTLHPSSHILLSPSSTPSFPPPTRPTRPNVFPTWDEDYDTDDMTPLEPTELLLPDMNSLEYYSNLMEREREKERGGRGGGGGGAREREGERDKDKDKDWIVWAGSKTSTPLSTRSGPTAGEEPSCPPTNLQTSSTLPPAPIDSDAPQSRPAPQPPANTTGRVPPRPTHLNMGLPLPGLPARPDKGLPPQGQPTLLDKRPPTQPDRPAVVTDRPVTTSSTHITAVSLTRAPSITTPRVAQTSPTRQYLCNITKPEMYLVRVGKLLFETPLSLFLLLLFVLLLMWMFPTGGAKSQLVGFNQVRDLLRRHFNRSVELQVQTCSTAPPQVI